MTDLMSFFQDRNEGTISLLKNLVEHESPSHDKAAVDGLGAFLRAHLEGLGAKVQVHPRQEVGDILLGTWNAEAAGAPLLILCHMDTVWPLGTLAEAVPWRRDEHKLYGPGVLDMKAGIAIALTALAGLQERGELPARPLRLLLTSDEEIGSHHSQELILQTAADCALCLVMEPAAENEGLKTSRKGGGSYTLKAKGRAAHAGHAPEEGVNATVELAHQILAIQALNQLRQGTSVSPTLIQGGTAGNVIPAEASVYIDVRFFLQAEADRVDAALRNLSPALLGSHLELEGRVHRYPMERTPQIAAAAEKAKALAGGLGMDLGEAAVGGVSDANLTAHAGFPTLDGLGGQGDGMHALHEHVLIRSLYRRAALLAALLTHWD